LKVDVARIEQLDSGLGVDPALLICKPSHTLVTLENREFRTTRGRLFNSSWAALARGSSEPAN
jgi:hypothetical protein